MNWFISDSIKYEDWEKLKYCSQTFGLMWSYFILFHQKWKMKQDLIKIFPARLRKNTKVVSKILQNEIL